MENLIQELKEHLIEELNLEEITPEEIDAEAPLFGDGLVLAFSTNSDICRTVGSFWWKSIF